MCVCGESFESSRSHQSLLLNIIETRAICVVVMLLLLAIQTVSQANCYTICGDVLSWHERSIYISQCAESNILLFFPYLGCFVVSSSSSFSPHVL